MTSALSNKRILVVEDEFIVAALVTEMLSEFGAVTVGPASRVAEGVKLATTEEIDAAILDMNMNGERSDPVAEALKARNIPFLFTTGYGPDAMKKHASETILSKPYTEEQLENALSRLIAT